MTTSACKAVTAVGDSGARQPLAQCASAVMMIRPAAFSANPETAASNAFQSTEPVTDAGRQTALAEFDGLVRALDQAGVDIVLVHDQADPPRPDAVFPNNWLSLHHDGTAVLYPMLSPLRRRERRRDVLGAIEARGFQVRRVLDLTGWESSDVYLEGTGSVVFDHRQRIAYACVSPRTQARPLEQLATELGYRPELFTATGPAGEPVYHTNVLMCVGEDFATLCCEAIGDPLERRRLREGLEQGGREMIEIDRAQMNSFAGNMLALETRDGGRVVALSASAWGSLDVFQRRSLERRGAIVAAAVPTLERFGGGSVRCMLAEIFLPRDAADATAPAG
jgi:hypothetical protein